MMMMTHFFNSQESCASPQTRKKRATTLDYEATVSAGLRVVDPGNGQSYSSSPPTGD